MTKAQNILDKIKEAVADDDLKPGTVLDKGEYAGTEYQVIYQAEDKILIKSSIGSFTGTSENDAWDKFKEKADEEEEKDREAADKQRKEDISSYHGRAK
jgi:hypothetical protein